jgi:hypothetical protein
MVKMLLDCGANVHAKNIYGETALHKAGNFNNGLTAKLRFGWGQEISTEDSHSDKILKSIPYRGNEAIVRLLLDFGADINAKNVGGDTALHYAAYWGKYDRVKLLLECGADPSIIGSFGTAMTMAASRDRKAVVELLTHWTDK